MRRNSDVKKPRCRGGCRYFQGVFKHRAFRLAGRHGAQFEVNWARCSRSNGTASQRVGCAGFSVWAILPPMCNRYVSPQEAAMERYWSITGRTPGQVGAFPPLPGPVHPPRQDDPGYSRELIVGQWGLIPWFAKEPKLPYSTNNARSEELAAKASYKHPWARGQRCIIPAESFDEPCWETGKNVLVDLPPRRWRTTGPGRPVEYLGRQGNRRGARATPCLRSTRTITPS